MTVIKIGLNGEFRHGTPGLVRLFESVLCSSRLPE